jgi:tetratricopeptide (TPR) repeat protein
VIATFGVMTYRRNADYTSDERIWSDTVAKRPSNSRARANYAAILVQQQRFTEAEAHLRAALALHPDYPEAHVNLGAALCSQGRLTEGIEHFRRAIALQPDYRDAHRNLGEALATMGRNAEAVAAFRQALETAPDDVVLMNKVGWLLATAPQDDVRDGQEALSLALRAVELSGGQDVDSLDTLAAGYAEVGRFSEASATIERALALAQSRGQSDLLPQLQYRLDLYRAGQRFREPLR